jgi:type I restriction enzyme S subunit
MNCKKRKGNHKFGFGGMIRMRYKLKDIFDLQIGKTPSRNNSEYWNTEDHKWISIADLTRTGKYISETKEYLSENAIQKSGIKVIPANTVVMSFKLSIGKTAITAEDMYSNEAIMAFLDKHVVEVLPEYILYMFKFKNWDEGSNEAVMGKTLNKAILSEIEIDICPIEEQRVIVDVLDKMMLALENRENELFLLDDLIKARFVEMFGNSVLNEKGWITDTVDNLCKEIYGGGTPSKVHPEYYKDGDIPWVSSKDMKTDILTDSQIKINQMGVENSTARMVPVNSVIMVIRSGILKHTLPVAINAVPITVNQDLKVFIPSERILTRFLAVQFKMHEKDILTGVRAVTADNIEFNSLKQRKLIVPSIELQQEYVLFLEQVDKSKVAVQKALDETQMLFDSLMQKYFG